MSYDPEFYNEQPIFEQTKKRLRAAFEVDKDFISILPILNIQIHEAGGFTVEFGWTIICLYVDYTY